MAINKLSKEAEQRLVDSLEKVADLVSEGEDPNEAMAKVASDMGIPSGHVNLMVSSFNTGRTEAHRKTAEDVFEKAAEFELADTEKVLEIMYPRNVKSASQVHTESVISKDYSMPPEWYGRVKKAQAKLPELTPMTDKYGNPVTKQASYSTDPMDELRKKQMKVDSVNKQLEEKRAAVSNSQDKLYISIVKLAEYFSIAGSEPYAGVKNNMIRMYGKQAESLFEVIEKKNKQVTKQASLKEIYSPVNLELEPYSLVKECLANASSLIDKKAEFEAFQKKASEVAEVQLRPFTPGQQDPQTLGVLESSDKEAAAGYNAWGVPSALTVGAALAAGRSNEFNKTIEGIGSSMVGVTDKNKLLNKSMNELNDPYHIARLRNMQTSAMLTDLMANDEIISSFDPSDVLTHYNEISQLAPRAAGTEGFMRAFLRKRLESGKSAIDPFDIDQIVKIENQLKKRDSAGGFAEMEV